MRGNADVTFELREIATLIPSKRNARTHSKKQIAAIADSIREFGFINPIIVDSKGTIVAGHGRYAAAKLLGYQSAPVAELSGLSDTQIRAYALADNKIAERAGWDRELLSAELSELAKLLPAIDLTLSITGFEVPELDLLFSDFDEPAKRPSDDDIPRPQNVPVSRPGDIWQLGNHRILCADARDADACRLLMAGELAQMAFTDPPYNVAIPGHVSGNGSVVHDNFAMASGEMTREAFKEFLHHSLRNVIASSKQGAIHYVCMDWRSISDLIDVARPLYSDFLNICVWNKTNAGMGSIYRSQHEMIAVLKTAGSAHINNIELGKHGRNRTNVWTYPGSNAMTKERSTELKDHPTPKPVALIADAIKDATARNDIVLDTFSGSGSTIIAAERTGRRAFAMEIEPRYVDVTIARFEALTGKDALNVSTGEIYSKHAYQCRKAVR